MWFPNDAALGAAAPATAFISLLWHELFDVGTPDSYLPRLSNTTSLIRELCETAKRTQESDRWLKYFEQLQAELKKVGESEQSVLSFSNYYQWLVNRLCECEPEEAANLARVAFDFEPIYRKKAAEYLSNECLRAPFDPDSTERALRLWATIVVQTGCSLDEIKQQITDATLALPIQQLVTKLVQLVERAEAPFWCCLVLIGNGDDARVLARKAGFKVLKNAAALSPHINAFVSSATAQCPGADITCVSAERKSRSAQAIAYQCIRSIRNAVDVCNFYSESPKLTIFSSALTRAVSGEYVVVSTGEHQFRKRNPRRARELTITTLKRVPEENLDGRILNALEHYNLAHHSNATRVKLVNLWTATECLAGSSESIIASVCDLVSPIVVWRRSDKLLNYAASCLNDYRQAGNGKPLPGSLTAKPNAISREELLLILARPVVDAEQTLLLDFASSHPLLAHRLRQLNKTFSNPKTLLAELHQSKERVRWHLYRIYRSRNLIVHEGKDSHLSLALLDNLHYYFSITLSRLLHSMQQRKGLSLDESISFWKSRSDYLLDNLKKNPRNIIIKDLFAVPVAKASTQVWPTA